MSCTLENSSPATTKKQKSVQSKLQKRFEKLWSKIQNQKKYNEKLQIELDKLGAIYRERILPVELESKAPIILLAEKLITLYSRKSMALWHREELALWILESIAAAHVIDLSKAEHLKVLFLSTISDFHDMDVNQIHEEMARMEREVDDEKVEFVSDTDDGEDQNSYIDDFFADHEVPEEDGSDFEGFFNRFTDQKKAALPTKLDGKWIKNLFRKTANALHPDKETDSSKRADKEILMTELLRARDEKDVLALMTLYHTHVSQETLIINDDSLATLCEQLQHQHDQLLDEKEALTSGYGSPVNAIVYNNLYGKNPKQQEIAIADYIEALEEEKQSIMDLAQSMKNLKVLKQLLEIRYEARPSESYFEY